MVAVETLSEVAVLAPRLFWVFAQLVGTPCFLGFAAVPVDLKADPNATACCRMLALLLVAAAFAQLFQLLYTARSVTYLISAKCPFRV
jgi:hypothetical protein